MNTKQQRIHTEPLAVVTNDGVLCKLCGKFMEQAGTHFVRKHGFPANESLSERLIRLGLPEGTRLCSKRLQDFYRTQAERLAGLGKSFRKGNHAGSFDRRAPRSEMQRDSWSNVVSSEKHGSQFRKLKARRIGTCEGCGTEVVYVRKDKAHHGHVFCGKECAGRWLGKTFYMGTPRPKKIG